MESAISSLDIGTGALTLPCTTQDPIGLKCELHSHLEMSVLSCLVLVHLRQEVHFKRDRRQCEPRIALEDLNQYLLRQ
eukprot:21177-Eustigmatos_ZCMA.PRE.1